MRRNVRERVTTLAPFLSSIRTRTSSSAKTDDFRGSWTPSPHRTAIPIQRISHVDGDVVNYMRNSVKVVIDAYDGTTTFYVFDSEDPILATYRRIFPALFKDAALMPPGLRKHVRYPERLLTLQAEVYGLYHMTILMSFYNREDLWTVANEVGMGEAGEQRTQVMQPNFVLMKLPDEKNTGVRSHTSLHSRKSKQHDRLDCRTL